MGCERARDASTRAPRWSESSLLGYWHGADCSNILALPEGDERPSVVMHLEKYYDSKSAMDAVMSKLVSC